MATKAELEAQLRDREAERIQVVSTKTMVGLLSVLTVLFGGVFSAFVVPTIHRGAENYTDMVLRRHRQEDLHDGHPSKDRLEDLKDRVEALPSRDFVLARIADEREGLMGQMSLDRADLVDQIGDLRVEVARLKALVE